MAKFFFTFMGSIIAGIWVTAAFVHYILPDDWMMQWYGFPFVITSIFFIAVMGIISTYFATRND